MSSIFRSQYRELSDVEKTIVDDIKERAQLLLNTLDFARKLPHTDPRHLALAQTNLEQAVMWAVKGVTG